MTTRLMLQSVLSVGCVAASYLNIWCFLFLLHCSDESSVLAAIPVMTACLVCAVAYATASVAVFRLK